MEGMMMMMVVVVSLTRLTGGAMTVSLPILLRSYRLTAIGVVVGDEF